MRALPSSLERRLLEAADTLAAQGFEDVKVDDLTAATGIPRATLYYYFDGKDGVLAWFLQRWLTDITSIVDAAVRGPGTGRERLEAMARTVSSLMAGHPSLARQLAANLGSAARLPELAAALDAAFNRPLRRLLQEGAADGSLREVDIETTSIAIFGVLTIPALWYLVTAGELDADAVADQVVALVIEGLAPR
jgi:TetR/AcrR family transcriptional regulator